MYDQQSIVKTVYVQLSDGWTVYVQLSNGWTVYVKLSDGWTVYVQLSNGWKVLCTTVQWLDFLFPTVLIVLFPTVKWLHSVILTQ